MKRDLGLMPELHFMPVDSLISNQSYQRSVDTARGRANIKRIAENFSWPLFGVVTIAPSLKKGKYSIIDGQHRVEAARRVGLDKVPCLLVDVKDVAEQAKLFVSANKNRVALTPIGIFNAMLASGDPVALSIKEACRRADVEILRYPVQACNMKAGQTMCVSTLKTIYSRHNLEGLEGVLRVLTKHWKVPGSIRADRLRAISNSCGKHPIERVDEAIKELTPEKLNLAADNHIEHGCPRHEAMHREIVNCLERGLKSIKQEEPRELLTKAVRRRCERCSNLFETRDVGQTTCGQERCK